MPDNGTTAAERPPLALRGIKMPTGRYLVGTLIGIRDAKPFQRRDGSTAYPSEIGIHVGTEVVAVQYRDRTMAEQVAAGTAKGEALALRVDHKFGARKDGSLWSFYGEPRDGDSAGADQGWE